MNAVSLTVLGGLFHFDSEKMLYFEVHWLRKIFSLEYMFHVDVFELLTPDSSNTHLYTEKLFSSRVSMELVMNKLTWLASRMLPQNCPPPHWLH